MRTGHLNVSRPPWHDRNPSLSVVSCAQTITGAQVTTSQGSITVPSLRKGYIDAAQIDVFRTANATPNGRVIAFVVYNNGTGNASLLRIHSSVTFYGPMGDQWIGQGGILVPGDVVQIFTFTDFVDGTLAINGTIKVTLFDA